MKTEVSVIVYLEVEHTDEIPDADMGMLASDDLRHMMSYGYSSDYGNYRINEIRRVIELGEVIK